MSLFECTSVIPLISTSHSPANLELSCSLLTTSSLELYSCLLAVRPRAGSQPQRLVVRPGPVHARPQPFGQRLQTPGRVVQLQVELFHRLLQGMRTFSRGVKYKNNCMYVFI